MEEYLDLVETVAKHGSHKPNRTGIDTISLFSQNYTIDLSEGFPLLTTKNMYWDSLLQEFFWFLSGDSHIRNLREETGIWDAWADEEGNLDTSYGRFWRRYPLPDDDLRETANGEIWADEARADDGDKYINDDGTFDQIAYIVDMLKNNPQSRRIVLTAWHPANAAVSTLPPCHYTCVFNVQGNKLNAHLTQRSGDIALGVPFNIASYSLLTFILAQEVGLEVGKFSHEIVDAHIYCGSGERGEWYSENLEEIQSHLNDDGFLTKLKSLFTDTGVQAAQNHIEANAPPENIDNEDHLPGLLTQLSRTPTERPEVEIPDKPIDELGPEDITLKGYNPDEKIPFYTAE